MNFNKNLLVPQEVYSARVNLERIPIVEHWFYEEVEFFPPQVREDSDFARYCLRMGHAYMVNLNEVRRKLYGDVDSIVSLGYKVMAIWGLNVLMQLD